MSAVRKVFIAVALMGTGLGVAYLLGQPNQQALLQSATKPSLPQPILFSAPPLGTKTDADVAATVKLVPESPKAEVGSSSAPGAPALLSSLAPISATPIRPTTISDLADVPSVAREPDVARPTLRVADDITPVAKLRDEAPRAIGNEPRSPATIRRMPPVETVATELLASTPADDPYPTANTSGTNGNTFDRPSAEPQAPSQQLLTTSYNAATTATPAAHAAYTAPQQVGDNQSVAPPPWPTANEEESPRTHIVEDGDSLEMLANQYLGDPLRSKEIFEFNRHVLSDPNLLPIGAELRIPDRALRNAWSRQSRRLGEVNEATIRQAASGNLVPIRHALSYEPENQPAPQAQLTSPVAIE
ncbi:MAG: LysM peptidoglycan-binding domain-containing protein [Pirellulales bacterium]